MKILALGFLLVVGCYSPRLSEGGFFCGPSETCPSGQRCYSGKCYSQQPVTDGGQADIGLPEVPPVRRDVGDPCTATVVGGVRTDNCVPGATCVAGNVQEICMTTCSNDQGCSGGTTCENRGSAQVCGLPAMTCDPVARTGCPSGRTCFLEDTRTICEIESGDGQQQTDCLHSRECLPGYTCATAGPGVGRCYRVCSTTSVCTPGTTCMLTVDLLGYCF
jgi:hypothetical protein